LTSCTGGVDDALDDDVSDEGWAVNRCSALSICCPVCRSIVGWYGTGCGWAAVVGVGQPGNYEEKKPLLNVYFYSVLNARAVITKVNRNKQDGKKTNGSLFRGYHFIQLNKSLVLELIRFS
jgi:hypothetical protein